ncbi:hypothetical protein HYX16_00850 [Candidatus Woesearchaeota archaeon]|nr:hypothetical protein [Candidatus Woesearchaeota archaeon]
MKIEDLIEKVLLDVDYEIKSNLINLGVYFSMLAGIFFIGMSSKKVDPFFEKNPYLTSTETINYSKMERKVLILERQKRKAKESIDEKKEEETNVTLKEVKNYLEEQKNLPEVSKYLEWKEQKISESNKLAYISFLFISAMYGLFGLSLLEEKKYKNKMKELI